MKGMRFHRYRSFQRKSLSPSMLLPPDICHVPSTTAHEVLVPLLEFVDLFRRALFPESLSPPTHVGRVIGESLSLPSRQVRDWNSHWGEPVASPSQNFLASLYGGTDDDVRCYFQCWRLSLFHLRSYSGSRCIHHPFCFGLSHDD